MRTVYDLQAVLDSMADDAAAGYDMAAHTSDLTAAGPQSSSDVSDETRNGIGDPLVLGSDRVPRRNRRRGGVLVSAGLLAAAAATAALLVVADPGTDHPVAGGDVAVLTATDDLPNLHFAFDGDAPDGTTIRSRRMNLTGQTLQFITYDLAPDPGSSGPRARTVECTSPPCFAAVLAEITLYYRGAADLDDVTRGHKVDVNGHPGFYSTDPDGVPTLYWQYADGAWAKTTAGSGTAERMRAVELAEAESVRADSPRTPIPVDPPANTPVSSVVVEQGRDAGSVDTGPRNHRASVAWGPDASEGRSAATARHGASGSDWAIKRSDGVISAYHTDSALPIRIDFVGTWTDTQLDDYLAGVRLADDVTDRGTWFDAGTVLP